MTPLMAEAPEQAASTDFTRFSSAVHETYTEMARGILFTVDVPGITDAYLAAWPEGTNKIYRTNTEHDCNCCKSFIKNLGVVVAIAEDGSLKTVWDCHEDLPYPYNVVAKTLRDLVAEQFISGVFRTEEDHYGVECNYALADGIKYNHFHGQVTGIHRSSTPDADRGTKAAAAHVLRRGLTELRLEDVEIVIDLVEANQLYRGAENLASLQGFKKLLQGYAEASNKDTFVWQNIEQRGAQIRNTAIGTLLIDLSKGEDLEKAVRSFESKVDATNYKRTTAVITPKMIDAAMADLAKLGLEGAVNRRHARIEDVSINDVLWADGSVRGKMREGLAAALMESVKPKPVSVKDATPISGEDFFANIVPKSKSIQVLVENRHLGNFMSLTAAVETSEGGRLFKWPNDFSWGYDGDVADGIKQRVKAAGGKVDALLRTSLAWSNYDDLDLHVHSTAGGHIYFGHRHGRCGGQLDVDMNAHGGTTRSPVENIYWKDRVPDGTYHVTVNNFCRRESIDVGFTLEVEFAGQQSQFTYSKAVPNGYTVNALVLTVKNGKLESIKAGPDLVGGEIEAEKWGIKTGQLAPVDTLMLSPNYWNDSAVGNKHFFFILKDCKNPDPVRGIFNEFLRNDLDKHRKVFEVVGARTKAPFSEQQLSGLGFSSTRHDQVTVVADGRAYAVSF